MTDISSDLSHITRKTTVMHGPANEKREFYESPACFVRHALLVKIIIDTGASVGCTKGERKKWNYFSRLSLKVILFSWRLYRDIIIGIDEVARLLIGQPLTEGNELRTVCEVMRRSQCVIVHSSRIDFNVALDVNLVFRCFPYLVYRLLQRLDHESVNHCKLFPYVSVWEMYTGWSNNNYRLEYLPNYEVEKESSPIKVVGY